VVRHERPQALLMQSNGRFLIQPPRADFSLRQAVAKKLAEVPAEVRRQAAELARAGTARAADRPYVEMLS